MYVDKFKFQTVSTPDFKACLLDYFSSNSAVAGIDWEAWVSTPGKAPSSALVVVHPCSPSHN